MDRYGAIECGNRGAFGAPFNLAGAQKGEVGGKHGDFQFGGPKKEYLDDGRDTRPRHLSSRSRQFG
jgi:hypothetical protein